MNEYKSLVQLFSINYINYCKANNINISERIRGLKVHQINLSFAAFYNWKYGNVRNVPFYTLVHLANSVDMPITYFFTEHPSLDR